MIPTPFCVYFATCQKAFMGGHGKKQSRKLTAGMKPTDIVFNSTRWHIKRQFNALYSPNDFDLLYIFKDFHRQLYRKTRLVMQSICGRTVLKYSLSLFYITNKKDAFKFTDKIMYINLISEFDEDYDLYDINFCHMYSKCILKALIFEEIFEELIFNIWKPETVFDWCYDEETKALLGENW